MPEESGYDANLYNKSVRGIMSTLFDKPVTYIRENIVEPMQAKGRLPYYHRKFNRVPDIDECEVEDWVCQHEANMQFKRDKEVDTGVMNILKSRRIDCEMYHESDAYPDNCGKAREDYETAATNWFIKYGDLGAAGTARTAYMKQKHRMLWERRYGPVGTGMNQNREAS